MTMTTEEKNILIAEFDGWMNTGKLHPFSPELGNTYSKDGVMGVKWAEKFEYHTSWDWLIPVCNKLGILFVSTDINVVYDDVINRIMAANSKI